MPRQRRPLKITRRQNKQTEKKVTKTTNHRKALSQCHGKRPRYMRKTLFLYFPRRKEKTKSPYKYRPPLLGNLRGRETFRKSSFLPPIDAASGGGGASLSMLPVAERYVLAKMVFLALLRATALLQSFSPQPRQHSRPREQRHEGTADQGNKRHRKTWTDERTNTAYFAIPSPNLPKR